MLASILSRLSRCDSPVPSMSPQQRRIKLNAAATSAAEYARVAAASSGLSSLPLELAAWASWVPVTPATMSSSARLATVNIAVRFHEIVHRHFALSLEVELCVRAHNCFLEACSMEGISRVLHRCHRLTPYLVAGNHFNLLVSLLTGMARYSEMTYVFDLLQQHHHFELLFQKGMEKVPYLRVALLDYLKHRGCADTDLYSMLTLNFNMHREIAENLESAALKKMNRLSGDGLKHVPGKHSLLPSSCATSNLGFRCST
ncbi:hypothetical protein HPB52_019561 [Rhipicephalus sanguineus]|uniref:Spatacsin C-terminal domain-containing protein n=1 Tax=Rhipicephalus sanguineus TaxID=34632 RepID=A0A9D4Q2B6_RHISA|nr:hypothetical protein HPB52_019561 [Rhipicephalus sanguineus]